MRNTPARGTRISCRDDLQHSEGDGEGEDLDDQHDPASHDVGKFEEVEVQDPVAMK